MAYEGGKGQDGTFQRIINQMPPHTRYVEAFVGGGAILKAKCPAPLASIAIDADAEASLAISSECGSLIPELHVINTDAIAWLADVGATFSRETLVYCDPPYLLSTRRQPRRIYRCELEDSAPDEGLTDEARHEKLLLTLLKLDCLVMVSGYWSQLYADLLSTWRSIHFQAVTRGGGLATEWLWMNFPEPVELHDYRYLGENFRERERIKRKTERWVSRLRSMPVLERRALSAALAEIGDG